VHRHSREVEDIIVKLDLAQSMKDIPETIKKQTVPCGKPSEITRSKEEVFMLSRLSPSCHSEFIKNNYFLRIVAKYEGYSRPTSVFEVPIAILPKSTADTEKGKE